LIILTVSFFLMLHPLFQSAFAFLFATFFGLADLDLISQDGETKLLPGFLSFNAHLGNCSFRQ